MNDGNFIKIYRSLLEWEWYKNINTKILFLHMLLKANWKDRNFEGKNIKRGSFVSSYDILAQETQLTIREVRTAISHLKTTGEVTSKSTNRFTLFTVVNYDLYQNNDTQNDKQETSKGQTNDKLTTTIEEYKEGKEVKKSNVDSLEQPTTFKFTQDSFEISCVDKLIKSCNEEVKSKNTPDINSLGDKQKWADEFEKTKRLDERSEEDILLALDFAVSDKFWKSNIRSGKKFRNKFETLFLQGKEKQASKKDNQSSYKPQKNAFNNFEQRDYNYSDLEIKLLNN